MKNITACRLVIFYIDLYILIRHIINECTNFHNKYLAHMELTDTGKYKQRLHNCALT